MEQYEINSCKNQQDLLFLRIIFVVLKLVEQPKINFTQTERLI